MDEELSDHELEERLYAMLHHVDQTQNNLIDSQQDKNHADVCEENAPRATMRRYWRVGPDSNHYSKVNTPKDPTPITKPISDPKPNEVTTPRPPTPVDLSILQSPVVPQITHKTIEYIDHEIVPVVLESSDEDEVVEVALPPKPTITIESSDDELINVDSPTKTNSKSNSEAKNVERDATASPVPSVVSSVSDEFIRGDCIALNISSRRPDKQSFDFSLHGSDLLVQNTPSKKKKKKKNKEATTSTPNPAASTAPGNAEICFATPKSKAKNKKQKGRLFSDKIIPTLELPDIYDSDSNQSIDINKNNNPYIVTNNSLPCVDVYESDSNQSEIQKENTDQPQNSNKTTINTSSDSSDSAEALRQESTLNTTFDSVDLTGNDSYITLDSTGINESIVMANVTGFSEPNMYESTRNDISKFVSSKVPSILNEDLDFDHLKGKDKVCKKRYSPTTLRVEMDKFYNESWGGENFNHREIQKHMSRDKSLWAIDAKDRMVAPFNRKVRCNYCNRVGHRDDTCRQKPPICFMCGNTGHYEPRCPNKICLNCGAPNFMFSTMCRSCSEWRAVRCAECGLRGHPAAHCPSLWRRYHHTTTNAATLEPCPQLKRPQQLFCSGCARRGHLVHDCRVTLPFSGLPLLEPLVHNYSPTLYRHRSTSLSQDAPTSPATDKLKRPSKSPTVHETHQNKKRNVSLDERPKSPIQKSKETKNKTLDSTPTVVDTNKSRNKAVDVEKAPDFIAITSNRDNEGHLIQDNEVSDTSDAVTSARIYVTNDIINKLKTKEGEDWLKANMERLKVDVTHSDVNSFLIIKGKVADQEAFQSELRDWTNKPNRTKRDESVSENADDDLDSSIQNFPKNRNSLLRKLSKALDSLNENQGDPRAVYKELTYSQNKHKKLIKQKVISPQMLNKSRTHINNMLKKLNMILVGQAGLADGSQHVNVLESFREKLLNSRQKTISLNMRKHIAEHYDSIFTSSERDDYFDLITKYYSKRPSNIIRNYKPIQTQNEKRENYRRELTPTNNTVQNSVQPRGNHLNDIPFKDNAPNPSKTNYLKKLKFYHQRLQNAIPKNRAAKVEAHTIMRRVHAFMQALNNKEHLPSKTAKKVKKIQNDAQKFLAEKIKLPTSTM